MPNPWLHRFAILVAAVALIVIASGAFVTSSGIGTPPPAAAVSAHRVLSIVLSILTVALVIFLSSTKTQRRLRALAWLSLAPLIYDTAWPHSPGDAAAHASLAPLLLSAIVALALLTSAGWRGEPKIVDDRGLPWLRPLAISAPPLVLLQILMGAAYRHKLMSVMPHMAGAMIVSLATLIASMVVMQQYPEHPPLRRAAIALMSVLLAQVTLGVAAFTLQLLDLERTLAGIVSTVLHVLTGSLTLAASVVLAIQVRRCVRAKAPAAASAQQ
ncbi:MAG TPA: hypothetical protein VEV17_27325 [Bryobacteraceae bacterium]|nr:hypothetical protein [Bryobacteraceae bacterium]